MSAEESRINSLFKKAKENFNNKAYLKAITILSQCIDTLGSESFQERLVLLRGKCYLKLNQLDNAYDDLTRIPESTETLNYLGHLYFKKKSFNEAIHYYEQAKKERKKDYILRVNLAICYQKTGQPKKSLKMFNSALHIKDSYFPALKGRFEAQILSQSFDKAKNDFKKMISKKNTKLLKAGTKFIFQHLKEISKAPGENTVPPPPSSSEDLGDSRNQQIEIDAMKRELEQKYRRKHDKVQRERQEVEIKLNQRNEEFQRQKEIWSSFQKKYDEHQKEVASLKGKLKSQKDEFDNDRSGLEQQLRQYRKRNQQYVRLSNKHEEEIRSLSTKVVELESELKEANDSLSAKVVESRKAQRAIPMKMRKMMKHIKTPTSAPSSGISSPISSLNITKIPKSETDGTPGESRKRKREVEDVGMMGEEYLLSLLDIDSSQPPAKKQKIDNEYGSSENYGGSGGYNSQSMHPKKKRQMQFYDQNQASVL